MNQVQEMMMDRATHVFRSLEDKVNLRSYRESDVQQLRDLGSYLPDTFDEHRDTQNMDTVMKRTGVNTTGYFNNGAELRDVLTDVVYGTNSVSMDKVLNGLVHLNKGMRKLAQGKAGYAEEMRSAAEYFWDASEKELEKFGMTTTELYSNKHGVMAAKLQQLAVLLDYGRYGPQTDRVYWEPQSASDKKFAFDWEKMMKTSFKADGRLTQLPDDVNDAVRKAFFSGYTSRRQKLRDRQTNYDSAVDALNGKPLDTGYKTPEDVQRGNLYHAAMMKEREREKNRPQLH